MAIHRRLISRRFFSFHVYGAICQNGVYSAANQTRRRLQPPLTFYRRKANKSTDVDLTALCYLLLDGLMACFARHDIIKICLRSLIAIGYLFISKACISIKIGAKTSPV